MRNVLLCLCFCWSGTTLSADHWPRFRGPNGTGVSDLKGIPTNWTTDDYEWTVELPGVGHAAPVVWDEDLFVTAGETSGKRTLYCLNAITGKEKWHREVVLAANHLHQKNSYAASTPTVDGERVYVNFGDPEHYLILCFSFAGEELWRHDFGAHASMHGHGASLVLVDGKLIVCKDQEAKIASGPVQSFVYALDGRSGKTVWETPRTTREESFSTPTLQSVNGKEAVLCLSGSMGLIALSVADGYPLWKSGELPLRTVGSPLLAGDLLFATCGQGGRGQHLAAIEPETGKVRYVRKKMLPYVPTPLAYQGHLFMWNDDGTVCCVNPQTGDDVWSERVGGNYSTSPLLIDGRIYAVAEDGEVTVIDAAEKPHVYGKSSLGDNCHATPAVANGRLYLRGFHKLMSLKANP